MHDSSRWQGCVRRADGRWCEGTIRARRVPCWLWTGLLGTTMICASAAAAERIAESNRPGQLAARGSLVIIGGAARHDNKAIWSEVLKLAGGEGRRIAVFPSASSYPLKNGERAVSQAGDALTGEDVLPGLHIPVSELFEDESGES